MAVAKKVALPEEFDDIERQEYPDLLPRQNEAYGKLVTAKPGSYTILGYGGGMGGGKLAPLDSTVYTPFGPRRMGDIRVGSQVTNPEGGVSRVIAVHPQGVKDVYRFTFEDGASCEVGLEHLWQIRIPNSRRFEKRPEENLTKWRIATTEQVIDEITRGRRVMVPLPAPTEFTVTCRFKEGRWPIHPYVLGALLGDGHFGDSSLSLTCADEEIPARFAELGYRYTRADQKEGNQAKSYFYDADLRKGVGLLGLDGSRAWNKHVPEAYMVCPLEMRWELIRGLMDTDGYADSRGHCSYTTTSEQLAKDVQWLGRSLGFKCNVTSKVPTYTHEGERKEGRLAYTVWLKGESAERLFTLERKRIRAARPYNNGCGERGLLIKSVEFSRSTETQCITVDHPNGLYLTDDFIVTHNSILLSTIANQFLLSYPGTRILLCRDTLKALKETTLIDFMAMLPRQLVLKYNQSENWLRVRRENWPKGVYSQINFQGVHDYEAIGSAAYQIILLDEAHEIPDAAARFLLTRLRWQLPKSVKKALSTQCRHVERGEGGWIACGRRVDGECPEHGPDWVSDQVPYYFVATANPWPGWYTEWFWKGAKNDMLDALADDADVSLYFVQSLMRDNKHLPKNYEALNTVGLTPEERRRFIDGEFGVFTGMVYEMFDRRVHAWKSPEIPFYTRVIGGLDFGNESTSGHYTTGVVQLVTPSGRLLMVDEFKRRGPKVYEQQGLWMQKMQEKWGKPIGKKIEWRGDKAQGLGIKMMADLGFHITKSNKPGLDRIDVGIRHCAGLLNYEAGAYPAFFYLPEGHPSGGCPEFEKEMLEYRRDPETLKVVKENDDVVDAWRYSCELVQGISGDPAKLFRNALPQMAVA